MADKSVTNVTNTDEQRYVIVAQLAGSRHVMHEGRVFKSKEMAQSTAQHISRVEYADYPFVKFRVFSLTETEEVKDAVNT